MPLQSIYSVLAVLVVVVLSGVAGACMAMLRERRSGHRGAAARADLRVPTARRLSGSVARLAATVSASPASLRRDVQASVELAQTEADLELLAAYLVDIRDLTGAREAVFWRWSESRGALLPWAWSSRDGDRPEHFRMSEWGPRVRIAAETRTACMLGGRRPFFAATPVVSGARLHGVLTVAADAGLAIDRATADEWLPRHGTHVAMLLDLFEMRREYGRRSLPKVRTVR
jgi:hypothetical protein